MTGTPSSPTMTVAVAGASGFVGRHLVRELLSRGYRVNALARTRGKARDYLAAHERLSIIVGDISDHAISDSLLKNANACINLLGILRENRSEPGQKPQTFQRLHVDAVRILVNKCTQKNIRRFVQMSALNVSDMGVAEYQRTKFEGEMIVRQSELDWTIFRPSLIHGPGSELLSLAKGWASGHAPPFIFMPYFTRQVEDKRVPLGPVADIDPKVAPVSVNDVARAMAGCLENQASFGEVYNLVGSETLTWPAMLTFIRDNIHGAHPEQPAWGVPSTLAAAGATIAKHLGLGALLPFDSGMAKMGAEDSTASLDKARADLGFNPAPFRQSFQAYAASV